MSPDDPQISRPEKQRQFEAGGIDRAPLSDSEFTAWEEEDREEADLIEALKQELTGQTTGVVELEESWKELAVRAARQVEQARDLETELTRLREVADQARAARRAASAELSRAERRAANAQARVEELEAEKGELARELERALSEREAERERFQDAGRRLEGDIEAARQESARLQAELAGIAAEREKATELAERQAVEQRALVADLVGTQATLQARSEQLQNILRSRWHRVARSAWQARRRRPPLVAIFLWLVAVVGAVFGVLTAADLGIAIASVLAAVLVGMAALAYAIVVPGLRDKRVPRMAGDGTFARPLDVEATSQDAADEAVPTAEPAKATPVGKPDAPARVQLVPLPAPDADVDLERERWLSGARMPSLDEFRVAGILDEMSKASFGPECRLNTAFGAMDWKERLSAHPPHMLLVESAWSGNDAGWQYCVASYEHPRYAGLPFLRELLSWCRDHGIPTVFWNKEDPVHFDRFKEAAALFDHIFTSDANRVEAYGALDGVHCKTVEPLPFAAQPRLHNPIPLVEKRLREPVFAGTYYRDRHPDRQRSLEAILDAARPHGLLIYDRTFGSTSESYGFPERFAPHIKGRLSYEDTIAEYKRHLVFLNVNSVTDSPTMFSRRVFELLACGTAVLSTPSLGMQQMFGDLIPVAETQEQASAALERLLDDHQYRDALTGRAQRLVLSEHTYRDRLLHVARTVGFDLPENSGEETAVLAIVGRGDELDPICDSLLRQSRVPDEVILGLDEGAPLDGELDRLRNRLSGPRLRVVRQQALDSRSDRLRELASLAATPWVAPLKPSVRYGPDHLKGLVACTRFVEAGIVGTDGAASANGYLDAVSPDTAIADRELVARRGWPPDAAEMRRWFAQGTRIYAVEPHEPHAG